MELFNLPIYSISDSIIKLPILVKPNSHKDQIMGVFKGRLKVAIAKAPQDGEANKQLIAMLAICLQIPKRDVILINGHKSSYKVLQLPLNVLEKLKQLIIQGG